MTDYIDVFLINIVRLKVGLVYGVSHHFQQYFSYIVTVSFIGGGNRSHWKTIYTNRTSLPRTRMNCQNFFELSEVRATEVP